MTQVLHDLEAVYVKHEHVVSPGVGCVGVPVSRTMDIIYTIQRMRMSHRILLVVFLLFLTNIVTFLLSTSFQRLDRFDDDEFDYHIYDSLDYEHSYSYTGAQELGESSAM